MSPLCRHRNCEWPAHKNGLCVNCASSPDAETCRKCVEPVQTKWMRRQDIGLADDRLALRGDARRVMPHVHHEG